MAGTWDCACCGGNTGETADGKRYRQWWNQDDEYGICLSCATWIASREGWESVFRCYGKPGVHFERPTTFESDTEARKFADAFRQTFDRSDPVGG